MALVTALTLVQVQPFTSHFRLVRKVELEEPPGVLNVAPSITVDPEGGALVADVRESQVRRYSLDGRLLLSFGKAGGGPGEFPSPPLIAIRAQNGEILVGDAEGGVSRFSGKGAFVKRHRLAPGPIYSLVSYRNEVVVSAQRVVNNRMFLLHRWRPGADSLGESFFKPNCSNGGRRIVATTGGAFLGVKGDSLLVTFSMSDTLYLFANLGAPVAKRAIKMKSFTYHDGEAPATSPQSPAFREWMKTGARVERAYPLVDGGVYVQYIRFGAEGPEWYLAHFSATNVRTMDFASGVQLLFLSPEGPVFADPSTGSPSVWQVAALKESQ